MTISSPVRIAGPYIGAGTLATFSFPFKVFAAADLDVIKLTVSTGVQTTLALTTDYTVSLNADQNSNPGGSITLVAGNLASGYNLTITSDIENLQPTDLTNQGGFYPEVINDALDRATIQIQQVSDDVVRSLQAPTSDGTISMTLPPTAQRIGKYLAFDAAGAPSVATGTGADINLRTDLAASGGAALVGFSPTGSLSAVTVQAAIAEIGTDLATTAGAAAIGYTQGGTGSVARTVQAKLRDYVDVRDFGAVGDGVADDTVAIQAAIDYAVGSTTGRGTVILGEGRFRITSTLTIGTRNIALVGVESGRRTFGSTPASCSLEWDGGAYPMISTAIPGHVFRGFGVTNNGSGTDWLELLSGAQNNIYEDLYFHDNAQPFTRSVIYSNGNFVGYSQFRGILASSPAPVFLYVIDNGTSNAVTPISFTDRCIIRSATNAFTLIKTDGETIENIEIRNCTIIMQNAEMTVLDTTTSPASSTVNSFTFENNEIDIDIGATATWRLFKLQNINNVAFNNNVIQGGGSITALAAVTGCNIASCSGNWIQSLAGPLFDVDTTSRCSIGFNNKNESNTGPEFLTPECGYVEVPYSASMVIEGQRFGGNRFGIYRITATNGTAFTINVQENTSSASIVPGQIFTVVIRNASGGALGTVTFAGATFKTSGAFTAPANGFNRSITFYYDGSHGVEIMRSSADVAN